MVPPPRANVDLTKASSLIPRGCTTRPPIGARSNPAPTHTNTEGAPSPERRARGAPPPAHRRLSATRRWTPPRARGGPHRKRPAPAPGACAELPHPPLRHESSRGNASCRRSRPLPLPARRPHLYSGDGRSQLLRGQVPEFFRKHVHAALLTTMVDTRRTPTTAFAAPE